MLRVKANFICNYTIMQDMQEIAAQFAYIFAYFIISHLHFPCTIHPDPPHIPNTCQTYSNSQIYHRHFFPPLQKFSLFLSYLCILFHLKCHFHKKFTFNRNPESSLVYHSLFSFNETCEKNHFIIVISKILLLCLCV